MTEQANIEEMSPLMRAFARRDAMINIDNKAIQALSETLDDSSTFEEEVAAVLQTTLDEEVKKTSANEQTFSPPEKPGRNLVGKKQGGRKATYDIDKFVAVFTETCNNGGSPVDVALAMGMTMDQVAQRATQLRKKGYDIPQFKRGRKAS